MESAQADWSQTKRRPESFHDNDTRYSPRATTDVERRLRRVEKRLKSALWSHAQASRRAADHAELLTRVASLENASRSEARALFNVTQEVAGVERVQRTTAQLMESMSALESRLDSGLPELQREVSRLEFELAQATSSLQVAKDAQVRCLVTFGRSRERDLTHSRRFVGAAGEPVEGVRGEHLQAGQELDCRPRLAGGSAIRDRRRRQPRGKQLPFG